MLGATNKEYLERIVSLKQQLPLASDTDKVFIYETIYNCYVRMGLLLEAEKIAFSRIALLRKTAPKNKLVEAELDLAKIFIDNGKIQQGIEQLQYAVSVCKIEDAADKEIYLSILIHTHYTLSLKDKKYRPQYEAYLQQYENTVKPVTTLEKLNYYTELAHANFNANQIKKGLLYKKKLETLLAKATDLSNAYRERYKSYLQQVTVAAIVADPDKQKLIKYGNDLLEKNKQEKFLPVAAVFFWLRKLAHAYQKEHDVEGLKNMFNEMHSSINEYLEENIEAKIYEQKYQSDYFLQEQRLNDAEALNKVKDSVFSNFNHELRTPLNIILSNCELIAREAGITGTHNKRLAAIQNQSYNLLNIIDQFIEINKTNLQFNEVNNQVGDWVQFMQVMEADFSTLCEQKNILLKLEMEGTKNAVVKLDFAKLERILYNLITNAVKFTHAGGSITVSVSLDKKSSHLILSVTDTGTGIAQQELETIFQQFYSPRNDSENIKTTVGFGIGLYLVKQLVTLLGGKVTVQSKLKEGSTFKVEIPFVPHRGKIKSTAVNRRLNYKLVENTSGIINAETENVSAAISKPSLLIVEDNSDLLDVITESLLADFTIKTANDGQEAKELLNTFLPDLVITDLMMPRLNGIELTTHIKNTSALNHLPVIMLTAKGSLPNRIKGWEAGIDVFLRKPFAMAELEHCIHNIMQTSLNTRQRIATLLTNTSSNKKDKPQTAGEKFVGDFKSYVVKNIAVNEIRNADVAKYLQVDESSLYRKIKALTGFSPVQLVTKMKILKAKEIIESGQYTTLKEVAYRCGFNDPKYFSQVYKTETGLLPKISNR